MCFVGVVTENVITHGETFDETAVKYILLYVGREFISTDGARYVIDVEVGTGVHPRNFNIVVFLCTGVEGGVYACGLKGAQVTIDVVLRDELLLDSVVKHHLVSHVLLLQQNGFAEFS